MRKCYCTVTHRTTAILAAPRPGRPAIALASRRASGQPCHPADTLCGDAIRGLSLYRANMGRRLIGPQPRHTGVPVQLITLTGDHFVSPALSEGLERWVPNLTRRTLAATHWSALTVQALSVARMIREFAAP
jgi:hypothetical protein